ncbi:conserved oligomeric Golgi complex subunit 2 [Lycorma delicatula]|uniref:conserved oligomeric Golgi complex subunit 2 n=1 Tax=Lycorma delicatula TaxID=130591 RepID=UPI003F51065E
MPDLNENPVPRGPSDLCFNSNEFTRETFSVDHFLQDHRNKANLETMRDDLGVYLKVLRSAMIELINKDYTDFVNLSSNLIGLDKAINSIQTPLGQLKEELLQVQQNLDEAMSEISVLLEKRKKVREKKQILKSLSRINISLKKLKDILHEEDLNSMLLERAAAEYNQLQFHVSKCNGCLLPSDKKICNQLGSSLMRKIDNRFLSCFIGSDDENLPSLLGVYLTLGRASDAEKLYRKEIVAPAMKKLISEEALAGHPRGLQGVFNSIIAFINDDMKPLLQLSAYINERPPKIKGFEFLVNSFWPEVEERLEMNLTSIYAPGNPELFYQRYTESLEFLGNLENKCGNQDTIKLLWNHPNYSNFLQRWNLPVYFQIRFQEIAGELEMAMNEPKIEPAADSWQLNVTNTAWKCLLRCWADKFYLQQLAHRFYKLNLQILARYYTWSGEILEKKINIDNVQFLVALYTDIESLSAKLPEIYNLVHDRFNNHLSPKMIDLLKQSLDESKEQLLSQLSGVSSKLVRTVSIESVSALRQVSEVPRLFRRTNRETPAKALPYVNAVLVPPTTFHCNHRSHPHSSVWLRLIFSEITKQYYTSVCDVLTSVQKTEESLRRLKKIRDRGGGTNASGSSERGGDDDKIRLQLYIDVNSFCDGIEQLKIQRQEVEQLISLLNLVEMSRTS